MTENDKQICYTRNRKVRLKLFWLALTSRARMVSWKLGDKTIARGYEYKGVRVATWFPRGEVSRCEVELSEFLTTRDNV